MPELPDVEGFRAVLAEHGTGCRVERVEVADAGVLRDVSAGHLEQALRGHRFGDPERHGKWLIARTDGPALLMHFGMTGLLYWAEPGERRHRHDRVVFAVPGGELRFRDMRKLQGIMLAERPGGISRVLDGLGPDAAGIGRADFARALGTGRRAVKSALIDQSVIAGLGNLLADEICWRARIHPRRPVRDLGPAERARLHGQMRRVLREAIPAGRVPARPGWLTGSRDADGARCPRCGAVLARGRVAGRSTVWCPCCQPLSWEGMTERKPRGMSSGSWIDQQIADAQRRGVFDNLPGAGKPLNLKPQAGDYGQAWVQDYARREGVPPEEFLPTPLRLRKEIERLAEAAGEMGSEQEVREVAGDLNRRILQWRRIPVGPPIFVRLVNKEEMVQRWRAAQAAKRSRPAAQPPGSGGAAPETRREAPPARRRWWRHMRGR